MYEGPLPTYSLLHLGLNCSSNVHMGKAGPVGGGASYEVFRWLGFPQK